MLNGWPQGGVWLSTYPTDMRKSFDGLSSLVKNHLRDDPLSGRWYVFINRRRTILKILAFEAGGRRHYGQPIVTDELVRRSIDMVKPIFGDNNEIGRKHKLVSRVSGLSEAASCMKDEAAIYHGCFRL